MGESVGTIFLRQVESDMRKNEELAPESDMTLRLLDEWVARDDEKTILFELTIVAGDTNELFSDTKSLFRVLPPTTLISYLVEGTHFAIFPPTGLARVAAATCPIVGFLQLVPLCPQIP